MTQPLIESGDVTPFSGNSATPAGSYPAHNSGDLLVQFIHIDDDITAAGLIAPSAGPNSETLDISSTGSGGSGTSGPTNGIISWIASTNTGAGSLAWSLTASRAFVGHTAVVPSGEHAGVGTLSGYAGASGNVTNLPTPSWPIGAGEGGGTVLIGLSLDTDTISTTDPTGYTQIDNTTLGINISAIVAVRDAATTASETIASVNFTALSGPDSTSSIGIVVLGPSVGNWDQDGFRFGKDDGSESAHTWHAGQNVNVTLPAATPSILRIQASSSGDQPTQQMKLQCKKTSDPDSAYADVPVAP